MDCVSLSLLRVLVTVGTVHGQKTGHPLGSCMYTFHVLGEQQCSEQGRTVARLEDQVANLQVQVTSLLRQNEQLLQHLQGGDTMTTASTPGEMQRCHFSLAAHQVPQ